MDRFLSAVFLQVVYYPDFWLTFTQLLHLHPSFPLPRRVSLPAGLPLSIQGHSAAAQSLCCDSSLWQWETDDGMIVAFYATQRACETNRQKKNTHTHMSNVGATCAAMTMHPSSPCATFVSNCVFVIGMSHQTTCCSFQTGGQCQRKRGALNYSLIMTNSTWSLSSVYVCNQSLPSIPATLSTTTTTHTHTLVGEVERLRWRSDRQSKLWDGWPDHLWIANLTLTPRIIIQIHVCLLYWRNILT